MNTFVHYLYIVYCRKICNLYLRALETGNFLFCFATSANNFFRQCTYIVFINVKKPRSTELSKMNRNKRRSDRCCWFSL